MGFTTEQEAFWAGAFGDDYQARNEGPKAVAACTAFFQPILRAARGLDSAVEFGANIGLNMLALRQLVPTAALAAVEINGKACEQLRRLSDVEVHHDSILDFVPPRRWELSFTKGVLIHIDPARLPDVYDRLYQASERLICIAEYYSPSPVEIPYRGHSGRLFKRDFAGELLDRFADLRLVDYGFSYHRDPVFPQDDITWFLLEKNTPED